MKKKNANNERQESKYKMLLIYIFITLKSSLVLVVSEIIQKTTLL